MNFPLPDAAFNALHQFSIQPLRDKGNYRFDGVVYVRRNAALPRFSLDAPSKRMAKKDKIAVREQKAHGIKPSKAPDFALRNAGHVNRFSGKVETTRQF